MNDKIMNLNGLRDFLATELKKVAAGKITPATANASANIAGKILSSVKLELEYNKLCGTTPSIDFIKIDETEAALLENHEVDGGEK